MKTVLHRVQWGASSETYDFAHACVVERSGKVRVIPGGRLAHGALSLFIPSEVRDYGHSYAARDEYARVIQEAKRGRRG